MRWMNAGLTAAVLFSAPVLADDAQQTANTTMRAAMAEQAGTPTTTPHAKAGDASSDAKPQPGAPQARTMKHSPGAQQGPAANQAARLAHQQAAVDGTGQADALHAAMANKAAMNAMSTSMMGGASGTCQAGSDCQNASGMAKMTPGAGMMGGSTGGGAATPGTAGPTTGGGSMPMGGKR